jgi:hypothetical protein
MTQLFPGEMAGESWCRLGEKAQLSRSLSNLCLGDKQHNGRQKKNFMFWEIILSSNSLKCLCNPGFLLATYFVGNFLMFLKQRGFSSFPVTNSGSLSVPSAFQAKRTITSA